MKGKDIYQILGKYLSGVTSERENLLVEKWKQDSPKNLKEFELHKQTWDETHIKFNPTNSELIFKNILNKIDDQQEQKIRSIKKPVLINIRPFIFLSKIAATILLFGAVWYYATHISPDSKSELIVKTVQKHNPAGQKSKIYLPDGTEVWLNAESKITFPEQFLPNKREVILTGEAFFNVTKNPEQPFIVKTGKISTIVLGTSFNINAFENEPNVKVSLKTGKVKVEFENNLGLKFLFLNPGEAMNYNKTNDDVRKEIFNNELSLAWKDGVIVFEDAEFDEIINTLSRWYGVNFKIENRKYDSWSYTGSFDNAILENVLHSISFTKEFTYKINQKNVNIKFN